MKRRKESQPDVLAQIILMLGRAFWLLLSWPIRALIGRRPSRLDQVYYRVHWATVEDLLASDDPQHSKQAIVDADKLFDHAMRSLNINGATFADRLRSAEVRMSRETYQLTWDGHKLRNQIAHEVGYSVSKSAAETAVRAFKRGLQSLGAL